MRDPHASSGALRSFVRLSRPLFLLGGALTFALGAAAVESLDLRRYLLGQSMVTAAQITAHYVNEYADVEADRGVLRRTPFSGGSGVLAVGALEPVVALRAAWVSSALALLLVVATATLAPVAAALGAVALAVSWAYSMPPVRLLSTGWGELATSVVVAGLVPLIGATMQGLEPPAGLWWAIGLLLPVHIAMMLVFELPDRDADAASGKMVLAVRIGRRRTEILIAGLMAVSTLGLSVALAVRGLPGQAAWALCGAIPALVAGRAVAADRDSMATSASVATFVLATCGLLYALSVG